MKRYILKNKTTFLGVIIISFIIAVSSVLLSITMGNFTDAAVALNKSGLIVFGFFSILSLFMIFVFEKIEIYFRNKFTMQCIIGVKEDIYQSLLHTTSEQLHKKDKSFYINIIINELNTLRSDYYGNICLCIGYIFKIVLGSIALINLNLKLFISITAVSVLPMLINPMLKKNVGARKKSYIDSTKRQMRVINEVFNGIDTIKMNSVISRFKNYALDAEESHEKARFKSDYNDGSIVALTRFLGMCSQIICMLIAAYFVVRGELKIGGMITSTQLLNYIFPSINLFNSKEIIIKGTKGLQNDVENILEYSQDKASEEFKNGDIVFESFGITFNNKKIFDDFSYVFRKGSKIAVIGESGRGKSTLIKTIMGLNQHFNGDVKIGDVSVKDIKKNSLYKNISYAPQKPFIFRGSLEENITMFKEHDESMLDMLIERLKLNELRGKQLFDESSLSGGEASRIGTARALLRNFEIIIFDEPTGSLDPATSQLIDEIIFEIKNKTIIVITHNWNDRYLSRFDTILNLNDITATF